MSHDRFARICGVPASFRNGDASLYEVVLASGFADLRGQFAPRELAGYLRDRPALIDEWVAYSQDKRSADGWYLRPPHSVGRISADPPPMRELHYADLPAACAAFIVAELGDVLDRSPAV